MANSLTYFLVISVSLMMLMFVIDQVQTNLSEDNEINSYTKIFNYDGSHISEFNSGDSDNYTLDSDISNQLPTGTGDANVDEDSGNIFTDTFKTIKNWLLDVTGVKYVINALNILPNFLKIIIPSEFSSIAFALGYLWNALVIFALVFWLKGGNN